jgi:hypothetical protein
MTNTHASRSVGKRVVGWGGHNFIDLTGKIFGRLTVIDRAPNVGRKTAWYVRCACGSGERIVKGCGLHSGRIISCGCLIAEAPSRKSPPMLTGPTALINMTNRRFGRLFALSRAANVGQDAAWHVRCDCGTETVALAADLRSSRTRSCGCVKHETGAKPLPRRLCCIEVGSESARAQYPQPGLLFKRYGHSSGVRTPAFGSARPRQWRPQLPRFGWYAIEGYRRLRACTG